VEKQFEERKKKVEEIMKTNGIQKPFSDDFSIFDLEKKKHLITVSPAYNSSVWSTETCITA
jgi:hypothetical protein